MNNNNGFSTNVSKCEPSNIKNITGILCVYSDKCIACTNMKPHFNQFVDSLNRRNLPIATSFYYIEAKNLVNLGNLLPVVAFPTFFKCDQGQPQKICEGFRPNEIRLALGNPVMQSGGGSKSGRTVHLCKKMTKAGKPCKNRCTTKYCHLHN